MCEYLIGLSGVWVRYFNWDIEEWGFYKWVFEENLEWILFYEC